MRWAASGLLLLVLAAAACKKDDSRDCGDHCGCFSIDDCDPEQICFLGTCQSPGFSISDVYIDLFPPNSSGLLPQQDIESPRDLAAGLKFNIALRDSVVMSGRVQTDTGKALGGVLKSRLHPPSPDTVVLPSGRLETSAGVSSSEDFSLTVVPGTYDLRFEPSSSSKPPRLYSGYALGNDMFIPLSYPAEDSLVRVNGRVVASATAPSTISGAQVSGVALTDLNETLLSTTGVTDENGAYSLVFPPGARVLSIAIRPGSNPLVPEVTFGNLTADTAGTIPDIVLNVPEDVTITTLVKDAGGAPVADATILFDGQVGEGEVKGRFVASGSSDEQGNVRTTLLPGDYKVTVAPATAQTYAITSTNLCIPPPTGGEGRCAVPTTGAEPVQLTVGAKITVSGVITAHDGSQVGGARVVYTLQNAATRREFSTTSRSDGYYQLKIDPAVGDGQAEYEVVVEPDQSTTGFPRFRALVYIGSVDAHTDIRLYPPSFVYGRVLDAGGAPVADVTIALYSVELGSAGAPLLVGLGKSTSGGEFVIPLPTPGGN